MDTPKLDEFQNLENKTATEPALSTSAYVAIVAGIIVNGLNYVFPNLVNDDMRAAIFGVVSIAFPLILGWLIRRKVFSPASVNTIIGEVVDQQEGLHAENRQKEIAQQFLKARKTPPPTVL